MLLRLLALVSLPFAFFSHSALAYPNYITYGYQSCMSCHYNPHGNGPLTDYGRVLGAVEISSHYFLGEDPDEEEIADRSGFFAKPHQQDWFRPSATYRGLYLMRDAGGDTQAEEWIHMDASFSLVGKFLDRDRLIVAMQFGYAPKPRALAPGEKVEEFRSREHYIGYRINREWGVYLGLMDKVFGIRIPDHIAYSRSITGLNQNDQTHGLVLHYASQAIEIGIQPFVGNLVQDKDLRQQGVTTMVEIPGSARSRYGASLLKSSSDYADILMYSSHARIGFGSAHSLMAEIGQIQRTTSATDQKRSSLYVFTQTHYRVVQGFWGLLTLEALRPEQSRDAHNIRVGPGLQYFPIPKLELRSDAYWTNRVSDSGATTSTWDLAAQIHLWL